MDRSLRRYHTQRIKNNRKRYWFANTNDNPDLTGRALGMVVTTPHPCSCMFCSNPRVYEGDSLKERSQKEFDQYAQA